MEKIEYISTHLNRFLFYQYLWK